MAEGTHLGSVTYVQGSGDRAGSRISLHNWKTCVISCKHIFNYPQQYCWSSSSPGNPITRAQITFCFPGGIKTLSFSIAASEGARAVLRKRKALPG